MSSASRTKGSSCSGRIGEALSSGYDGTIKLLSSQPIMMMVDQMIQIEESVAMVDMDRDDETKREEYHLNGDVDDVDIDVGVVKVAFSDDSNGDIDGNIDVDVGEKGQRIKHKICRNNNQDCDDDGDNPRLEVGIIDYCTIFGKGFGYYFTNIYNLNIITTCML